MVTGIVQLVLPAALTSWGWCSRCSDVLVSSGAISTAFLMVKTLAVDSVKLQDVSLQTDTLSPTSSTHGELSFCSCCANGRGRGEGKPLLGYFS